MKNTKLILLLTLLIIISSTSVVLAEVELPDIEDHWAEDFIRDLVDMGAITGYPDGSYRPENKISRAEFSSVLRGALGLEEVEGETFSDTFGHWGEGRIEALIKEGIIDTDLYEENYSPDGHITREEIAMMTVRMLDAEISETETPFLDEEAIGDGYNEYVAEAYAKGIITGYPDTTFRPAGTATRAEAATMVIRALDVAGSPSEEEDPITTAPTIDLFVADNTTIMQGGTALLEWEVSDADTVTIIPEINQVSLSDSVSVSPTKNTTYTLIASNSVGSSTAELTIEVGDPPSIESFSIDKSMMTEGIKATLSWEVSNASNVTIEPDIGKSELKDSKQVSPTKTTTYTLNAENVYGNVSEEVEITVEPQKKIQPDPTDGYDTCVGYTNSLPNEINLYVGLGTPEKYRTLISFDLGGIPEDAVITYGYLAMYQSGDYLSDVVFDIKAHLITSSWDQDTVTMMNLPKFDLTPAATSPSTETTWRKWDIKNLIQGWVDGSIENYGLMLKRANEASSGPGLIFMYSSNYSDESNLHLRPRLTIKYYIPQ